MVCKIIFCSKFPDIPDKAGRKTRRRRTQAIAKRYAFRPNATTDFAAERLIPKEQIPRKAPFS